MSVGTITGGEVSQGAQFQDTTQFRQQSGDIWVMGWAQVLARPPSAMQDTYRASTTCHAGLESPKDGNRVAQDTVNVSQEGPLKSVSSAKSSSEPAAQPMAYTLSSAQDTIEPTSIHSVEQMTSTCVIA